MENLALLKLLHGLAGVLLLVALFALAGLCWRSRRIAAPPTDAAAEKGLAAEAEPTAEAEAAEAVEAAEEAQAAEATGVDVPGRSSPWPALCAILLLLCLVGLPVSGWWLAHLAGWPLGQPWLLGSSLLFLPGSLCGLWLASRVVGHKPGVRPGLGLALVGLLCFAASLGLMVVKPV
ncbi:DUF2269 family protein [Azotobacter beijerinckii]|uniref:Predicted integral membrane protein n=1 Tax=Azotobacter beijerinckii TaxID=170623 RepID=A0A1I4B5K4_9GAMM|nr:DUF2269 family protein [Azotobacter beijerinckii]SFA89704.1 Predicted integral membrane protein [Azotobacter beijerinckii]SFK63823.1 Predicted integral membrane protein [Azotobacter beijerinckii]